MRASWLRLALAAGLVGLLLSCGGPGRSPLAPSTESQVPAYQTTPEAALGELAALPSPQGVDPSLFSELKDALAEALRQKGVAKLTCSPPTGESNRVTDLSLAHEGDSTFRLTWGYRNTGDYNQDGIVNISDITPLAVHFNEPADPTNEWIDGNDDSAINISDITPLAANFFHECAGYTIETSPNADSGFTEQDSVAFALATGEGRKQFQHSLTVAGGQWVRVVPVDSGGARGTEGSPQKSDEFTFDVTWTAETTYIDQSYLDLLIDADTENHIYTFDAQGVAAAGLDISVDRILVIYGVALEKVLSVQLDGDDLIVEGENAYITDAIEDGTIAWDYGVTYTADKIPSMIIDGKEVCADGNGVIDYEFPWGDYTYHIKVELQDSFASFEFTISKDLTPPLGAKLILEGRLERFRVNDLIELEGRQLTQFDHHYEKLQGQGSISLVVAGHIEDPLDLVDLPTPLLIVPFTVGPIPVVLTIEAKFMVQVIVPAIDGSSRVTVSFSYDSDLGFNYDGIDVQNTGSIGSHSFNDEVTETGASSAIGVNFGVAFPRLKLSAFWGKVVPWAHIQFVIGGTWDPIKPCQTADYEIRGVGDVDFTLFKLSDVVGDLTFFQQKEKLLRAGD